MCAFYLLQWLQEDVDVEALDGEIFSRKGDNYTVYVPFPSLNTVFVV